MKSVLVKNGRLMVDTKNDHITIEFSLTNIDYFITLAKT